MFGFLKKKKRIEAAMQKEEIPPAPGWEGSQGIGQRRYFKKAPE